jgi:RNA polymerase sigma-70 factor (ECF subfamily)
VQRHQRQVYQLCYRFVGTHEDASDLAQDAFVRAYRGLGGFKGQSAFSTWLYRIAVNVCLNRVAQKRPPSEPIERLDPPDVSAERPDSRLLRDERAAEVRAAIASLPPKQRATLILRIYHELPHEEIASILGSSVGATKANLFHALARLKKVLQASR